MHPTRIFKTPEELYKAFEEYKANLLEQSQEWVKVQYVGKDGERVEEPQKVPMTLEGFYIYSRKHYGDVKHYFMNKEGYYKEFGTICSHIKDEVRNNQITGGLLGFFNPSITQRLNGLKEQTDVTTDGKKMQTVINLGSGIKPNETTD